MNSQDKPQPQPDEGEVVPVEDWIPHPVSDSAEYLSRPDPVYGDGLTGDAKAEFDAALAEREKRIAGHKPRARRSKRR